MRHLADVLRLQGQYTEAEALRRTLLECCREDLGDKSRETFWSMLNLAIVLQDGKQYEEAENLFRAALSGVEELRAKGENKDEDIWTFAEPFVNALNNRGLQTEANAVLHRTQLAWCRAELGNECRETARSMRDLALTLLKGGGFVEAEGLLREALGVVERVGGAVERAEQVSELSDDDNDVRTIAKPLINFLRARGLDADADKVIERVRRRNGKQSWFRLRYDMIARFLDVFFFEFMIKLNNVGFEGGV